MTMKFGVFSMLAAMFILFGANDLATAQDTKPPIPALREALSFEGDNWNFSINGRAQIDYDFAEAEVSEDFRLNDFELRRFRLSAAGGFLDRFKFKTEINIGEDGDVSGEDLWISYSPKFTPVTVKVGHFKTHNSLEELASSRFISTHERGAFTDAFEFDRRLGVALNTKGDNYMLDFGVFGGNVNEGGVNAGFAVSGRAVYNPVQTDELLVHLGASFRYRDQVGDELAQFRQRPYADIPGRIVSTGPIAEKDTLVALEALAISGRFWVTGEYARTFVNESVLPGNPDFDGWYLEGGVFFGGKRGYKGGKFDRPDVYNPVTSGGLGALSLLLRYDTLDLSEPAVDGGQLDTVVVSVDWWPSRFTHLSLNYFNADAALGSTTAGLDPDFANLVVAGAPNERLNGLTLRAQFDF